MHALKFADLLGMEVTMAYKTFAAIDVGSYELAMKIYEISVKNGIKEIDHIRHRIELGTDSYFTGKISNDRVDELCRMLNEFMAIMKSYKVDAYKAYGTSAVRESQNRLILLDQIETWTGIHIDALSNSEQRFLDYKSVASRVKDFQSIIDKSTAFIDIGGGSIQISLFDEDSLVTSQNIRPGVLRMREELSRVSYRSYQLEDIVEEIFGEIEDEHDVKRLVARELPDGAYEFSGRMEISAINEDFGLDIRESEEYHTLSGYILESLQALPRQGDSFEIGDLAFRIEKMTTTRIELVRIEKKKDA